jgi:hypothetical protein
MWRSLHKLVHMPRAFRLLRNMESRLEFIFRSVDDLHVDTRIQPCANTVFTRRIYYEHNRNPSRPTLFSV